MAPRGRTVLLTAALALVLGPAATASAVPAPCELNIEAGGITFTIPNLRTGDCHDVDTYFASSVMSLPLNSHWMLYTGNDCTSHPAVVGSGFRRFDPPVRFSAIKMDRCP